MIRLLPQRLQLAFRDIQGDLFDKRPTVEDVVFSVTGGEDLPKVMDLELRENVLNALKEAGYDVPEFTLQAYQYRPDIRDFFQDNEL